MNAPATHAEPLGARQLATVRVLFGAYLLVHFAQLWPAGLELFGEAGMLPSGDNPLRAVPNPLSQARAAQVHFWLGSAVLASFAFMLGHFTRLSAALLWLTLALLFTRNPLIQNPSMPMVGWLLLAFAVVPMGEAGLRRQVFVAAWILVAVAYSYSGLTKLAAPSWVDGSALRHVLENPLARPTPLRELMLGTPAWLLRGATWGVLALEILYAPLSLARRLRPWLWLAMVMMHLGILVLVDFADLTLGMLVLHAFTFDARWLSAPRSPATHRAAQPHGHSLTCPS